MTNISAPAAGRTANRTANTAAVQLDTGRNDAERSRTFSWDDPLTGARAATAMSSCLILAGR
jgi:hypothetical protein